MTSRQIGALSKETVIVQPIGAIEQHGAHLPVATDALIAEQTTLRALDRLPHSVACVTLPPLSYGKSIEHLGVPGTIALSTDTLIAVCRDVGRSVAAGDFRRLVFVNGHGGNPSLLDTVSRDIRFETGLMVFPINLASLGGRPDRPPTPDAAYGFHASEGETSLVLAIDETLVDMTSVEAGGAHLTELFPTEGVLRLEGAVPTAWLTPDVTHNGVLGDASGATVAAGEATLEHWVATLARALEQIATFEFPSSR
jgi:creatinine amidohydrolase/Fe(II)-dependent formamide hydrolase-like protein